MHHRVQARCEGCGRYRIVGQACWFCYPEVPEPCICDVYVPLGTPAMGRHRHLDHALLFQLTQRDYEAIDETILLPTEEWPGSDDDVISHPHEELVGITDGGEGQTRRYRKQRNSWRDDPEFKAFLKRYPPLRLAARQGIDSVFAFFGLTPTEADVWSLDAAGYTTAWIGERLRFKPGGVVALLESVQSKVSAKLARLDGLLGRAG